MSVTVFVVPYNLASRHQGTGAGPTALVAAGVVADFPLTDVQTIGVPAAANEVLACISIDTALASAARAARQSGAVPLVLAGNCHSCLGTLAATGPDVSIVWFDAHGDLNTTDTTVTGYLTAWHSRVLSVGRGPRWCVRFQGFNRFERSTCFSWEAAISTLPSAIFSRGPESVTSCHRRCAVMARRPLHSLTH